MLTVIEADLLESIESQEKALEWGMVGSRSKLDDVVLTDPDVLEVLSVMREDSAAEKQVDQRVNVLATMGGNPEYLHRYDLAIYAYLRALEVSNSDFAAVAAKRVAILDNVWWSRDLANSLCGPRSA